MLEESVVGEVLAVSRYKGGFGGRWLILLQHHGIDFIVVSGMRNRWQVTDGWFPRVPIIRPIIFISNNFISNHGRLAEVHETCFWDIPNRNLASNLCDEIFVTKTRHTMIRKLRWRQKDWESSSSSMTLFYLSKLSAFCNTLYLFSRSTSRGWFSPWYNEYFQGLAIPQIGLLHCRTGQRESSWTNCKRLLAELTYSDCVMVWDILPSSQNPRTRSNASVLGYWRFQSGVGTRLIHDRRFT